MSLDHLSAALEIKQVSQRVITGFAAAGGLDRVGDVIDMATAFTKTLAEKAPSDVAVFIGHDTSALPVGIPVSIEATPQGLLTSTKVFDGPAGDNLLAVARGLHAAGQSLGLSIGYRVTASQPDRVGGKSVRRLTGIDLVEYSFAARQSVANPRALTTGVKATGGAMQMRVEQGSDGKYHVMQGDTSKGSYDTEAAAKAAMQMMAGGKTDDDGADVKAEWSTAEVNDLPDSAFLFIQPGGQKDEGGKTVPRSNRHFPVKGPDGKVDLAHLRNALARIPQAGDWLSANQKQRLTARARTMLANANAGKLLDPSNDWQDGAPLRLKGVGYQLLDLTDAIAEEHAAMARLGDDTKDGDVIRPELRQKIRDLAGEIERIVTWAEVVGRDEEGAAQVNRLLAQLALMEAAV